MNQLTQTLLTDLSAYFTSLLEADWTRAFFMIIWLTCLFFPLKGIDIEDKLAAISYIFVQSTLGLMLFYPFHNLKPEDFDYKEYVSVYLFILIICTTRWFYVGKNEMVRSIINKGQQKIGDEKAAKTK